MGVIVRSDSGVVKGVYVIRRIRRPRKVTPRPGVITTYTISARFFQGRGGYITARRWLPRRFLLKNGRHLFYWVACAHL